MNRQVMTDRSGRWFNLDRAEEYCEDTRWDGHNHISVATGSQWEHETLYRTAGKEWVLHWRSQWQGTTPSWKIVDDKTAARWLVSNGHEPPDAAVEIAALEIQ